MQVFFFDNYVLIVHNGQMSEIQILFYYYYYYIRVLNLRTKILYKFANGSYWNSLRLYLIECEGGLTM